MLKPLNSNLWIAIGFGGQFVFSLRFLVQWWQSERQGRSVVPVSFWYLSLLGGIALLCYAIHKADPVFIVGQLFGSFIYLRNLRLIAKPRQHAAPPPMSPHEAVHPLHQP